MMERSESVSVLQRRVAMALGREACDLALTHADVVDVFGREVLKNRTVLVGDGHVLAVLPDICSTELKAKTVVDCQGRVLMPGLMDAHVHIESTLMAPEEFARAVLACGTTCVVADPHEIANVAGAAGIQYMLDASENLPVRVLVALPSCVPCTPFEDAGAILNAADLEPLMRHERVCSLGEVMNYPGLLAGDPDLLAKVSAAHALGKTVNGHCPGLTSRELDAYAGCGIGDDHEEVSPECLREHVQAGMYVFIREGSAARGLNRMITAVTPENAHRFCFCTDDLHAEDILEKGHINAILAGAVRLGLPAATAVAMATLHPAQCFNLKKTGAVAPGYRADLVLMEDLCDFRPLKVWSAGQLVRDEKGVLPVRASVPVPECILRSMHLGVFDLASLKLAVPSKRARVIGLLPHSLMTEAKIMDIDVDADGCFDPALNPGLCKIAVVERHKGLGLTGLGILDGYTKQGAMLGGALATSISHDSHNIVTAGSNDADMLLAVRTVAEMGGGIALVREGAVVASLKLPVGGLMTQEGATRVARDLTAINSAARSYAVSDDVDPVVTLSFMALCVIPSLKMNTRGLFDVTTFSFVPVDAGKE